MRVVGVDTVLLRPLELRQAFAISAVTAYAVPDVIVRVRTDSGVCGYGEAAPAPEVTGETVLSVAGAVDLVTDRRRVGDGCLLDRPLDSLDDVWHVMDGLDSDARPTQLWGNTAARCAVEQALVDAVARAAGQTPAALLGVTPAEVPSAVTAGIAPVDQTLAWVEQQVHDQAPVVRLKVGASGEVQGVPGLDRDVEVVREAAVLTRTAGVRLVADANQGFVDAERALAFLRRVDGCLAWLEQPVLAHDLEGLAEVGRAASTHVMADESVHGLDDLERVIGLGHVSLVNIKLAKSGGLRRALRMVDRAAIDGLHCQIGSMLESSYGSAWGALVYLSRPERMVSSDLGAWDHFLDDPWQAMACTAHGVTLAAAPRDQDDVERTLADWALD